MRASRILKTIVMPWAADRIMREEAAELAQYAAIPVPGETIVTLPAGTARVSYREAVKPADSEINTHFHPPASLSVSVRLRTGGEALVVDTSARSDMLAMSATRLLPPLSVVGVGTIEVGTPGEYVVTVAGDATGRREPHVLLG